MLSGEYAGDSVDHKYHFMNFNSVLLPGGQYKNFYPGYQPLTSSGLCSMLHLGKAAAFKGLDQLLTGVNQFLLS
jgi:hypothetical protein